MFIKCSIGNVPKQFFDTVEVVLKLFGIAILTKYF